MNWRNKRNRIVERLRETQLELRPPRLQQYEIEQARALRDQFNLLLAEYVENVPFVPVARCPLCQHELELVIDTVGLDSPWWWDQCPLEFPRPRACEHFQVFLGALELHGREPTEVDVWSVLPGPAVPFVIDRMLSMEGMCAVISTLRIGLGDTAYVIPYFSSMSVSRNDLHQEWRRQTWVVYDKDGNAVARDLVNDPWDFDLGPWLDEGKLQWIEPDDESFTLRLGRPCPYENLRGTRRRQIIESGQLDLGAPPDGTEPEYYAPY